MYFLNRRSKRNTTLVVLLVWLFAVASGIVNACVLQAQGANTHFGTAKPFEVAHVRSASTGHTPDAADHHGDELDVSKAPCLKVCDDGTQLLIKQQTSLDLGDPGSSFLASVFWTAVMPVVTTPRQGNGPQATAHGPPVRLRYARLTL